MTTLGILYPGHAAEDDYPTGATLLEPPVSAVVVHTVDEPSNTIDDARATCDIARLLTGAADLKAAAPSGVDAVAWACTAGSFVFGLEGAREQAAKLSAAVGAPATSTSLAFATACGALRIRRVAVGATYPADEAELFAEFLREAGVDVLSVDSVGIDAGSGGALLTDDEIVAFAVGADDRGADAILLPDTALRTMRLLERLETAAGKPVLTANQVTIWEALRLAGALTPQAGLGRLFRGLDPDPR